MKSHLAKLVYSFKDRGLTALRSLKEPHKRKMAFVSSVKVGLIFLSFIKGYKGGGEDGFAAALH